MANEKEAKDSHPYVNLQKIASDIFSTTIASAAIGLQQKLIDDSVEQKLSAVAHELREIRSAVESDKNGTELTDFLSTLTKLETDINKTRAEFQDYKDQISLEVEKTLDFMQNFPNIADVATIRMLRIRIDDIEKTLNSLIDQKQNSQGLFWARWQVWAGLAMATIAILLTILCSVAAIIISLIYSTK